MKLIILVELNFEVILCSIRVYIVGICIYSMSKVYENCNPKEKHVVTKHTYNKHTLTMHEWA
jgi:hypothetical protein